MKKIIAWIGWVIAGIMVALRIFRRGRAEITDVSGETIPAADQSGVPEQSAIERLQKKMRKGGALLLALAVLLPAVHGSSAPIILADEDQAVFRDALAAAWEYKGFLAGAAVVKIKSAERVSGDDWQILAAVLIPRQTGEPRAVDMRFRVTVRAERAGGVSWPAAVVAVLAGIAAGYLAGK